MAWGSTLRANSSGPAAKAFAVLFLPSVLLLCFLGQALLSWGHTLWGVTSYSLGAILFLLGARGGEGRLALFVAEGRRRFSPSLKTLVFFALLSGALLFYRLGSFPDILYNWESYTVHGLLEYMARPFDLLADSYLWNESLMTLSDRSLLVAGPILFVWQSFGIGLFQLRIVPALYGVLAVVVVYKLVEEHFGRLTAIISTVALTASPVFLLYSRTATNVGPTIFISLLVIYLFGGALSGRRLYFPLLGLALGIASYYYAVVRFIPVTLILVLAILLLLRRIPLKENGVPLFLMVAFFLATISPQLLDLANLRHHYFGARGEHVVVMWNQPSFAEPFSQDGEGDPSQLGPKLRALASLLEKNGADYANLYLSVNRSSVFRDFWNPGGEIIAPYLSPFLVLGLLYALLRLREGRYPLLILWFMVTSLPMLLTNNVHAGRLILSIPPMLIMAALGLALTYSYLQRLPRIGSLLSRIGLSAFLLLVIVSGAVAYFGSSEAPRTHAKRMADFLTQHGNGSDAYIFSTLSGLEAAELNFYTYYDYSFRYFHDNQGENFALTAPEVLETKGIYFYNVSRSAPQRRLEGLHNIVSQGEKAYLIMDKELYALAEEGIASALRREGETDLLYFFSLASKVP